MIKSKNISSIIPEAHTAFKHAFCLLGMLSLFVFATSEANAQQASKQYEYTIKDINWLTWDQAMTAMKLQPKKLFVFVEEHGSMEALKMDSTVFNDTVVNVYLNDYYYCVRMPADLRDTILFRNRKLTYVDDVYEGKGCHELVSNLVEFDYNFPASIVFTEEMAMLRRIGGFVNARIFGRMLSFYAHDEYLIDETIRFGQNYQCLNPNHPHNRLRNMSIQREQREQKSREE